jgi:hypothetical protein
MRGRYYFDLLLLTAFGKGGFTEENLIRKIPEPRETQR